MTPPQITDIIVSEYSGAVGNTINVVATDDFKVTDVTVTITDADGALIEKGTCQEDLSADCWVYTATVAVPDMSGVVITAVAKDVPGHPGTLEITL